MQTTSEFRFHFFYFHQDSKSKVFIEGTFLDVSDIREAEKPFFKRRGVKKETGSETHIKRQPMWHACPACQAMGTYEKK
jgi:hypothetical protein